MPEFYRRVADAYGRTAFAWKALIWVAVVLVTGAIAVAVAVLLPADHFARAPEGARRGPLAAVARLALRGLKNVAGLAVFALGVVMALPLVPGPGLVFMAIGLSMADFPGKRRLERRLLALPSVGRFINDVRAQFGKAPLVLP